MPHSSFFELQDIHYSYPSGYQTTPANNESFVLKGVNFSLSAGEKKGLIGHNGSGKTTLFHITMGLLVPSSGKVIHAGKLLTKEKDFRPLRRQIGYLFQQSDDQLFSPTVIEDVAFGPLNMGLNTEQAMQIAKDTLALLGMGAFAERITHRLSGGEKKMIALAAVLAMQPQAILLDEPTNDLDPDTRERLIEIINNLPVAHCIISHDWDFMHRTCNNFIQLKKGHLHKVEHAPHVHVHSHAGGEIDHRHDDGEHCHAHED